MPHGKHPRTRSACQPSHASGDEASTAEPGARSPAPFPQRPGSRRRAGPRPSRSPSQAEATRRGAALPAAAAAADLSAGGGSGRGSRAAALPGRRRILR